MKLADDIKQKVIDRLLLPGIVTKFIINFYIQAIRVFQFIDSSTILLEIISEKSPFPSSIYNDGYLGFKCSY